MTRWRSVGLALLIAAILFAPGCQTQVAGGGTGGTGAPQGGGTGGTGMVARGTVTGFGSVFVNGVEYQTNAGTTITVDGVATPETDAKTKLGLGMVVSVEATQSGGVWTATSIAYRSELRGPVENLDPVAGTFEVLGQRVMVTADTILAGKPAFDLTLLKATADPLVKVTGFVDASNTIVATRIEWNGEVWDSKAIVERRGIVGLVDTEGEFKFDAASGTEVTHDGTVTVTKGEYVRVTGTYDGSMITASLVEPDTCTLGMEDGNEFEVEGILTGADATTLSINGCKVRTGTVSGVAYIGKRVEVEGVIEASGQPVAREIEPKYASQLELLARIDGFNSVAQTVTVLGQPFAITVNTAIDNKAAFFSELPQLMAGNKRLSIHAYQSVGGLVATEIGIEDSTPAATLKGKAVTGVDAANRTFYLGGIKVIADASAKYPAGYDATTYFNKISAGSTGVSISGSITAGGVVWNSFGFCN